MKSMSYLHSTYSMAECPTHRLCECMNSNEMHARQVTQDDLDREFMPRRGRRKFTKEDAIYGLWADHDSDDEMGRYEIIVLHHDIVHVYIDTW